MRVLVLAPHPDDESIGPGGTLIRHVQQGDAVAVVFLTSGERGLERLPAPQAWQVREGEAAAACQVLGVSPPVFLRLPDWTLGDDLPRASAALQPILRQFQPELVYLPHPLEWHPDHRAVLPLLHAAFQSLGLAQPILRGYEVWTPMPEYHHAEDISAVMETKLAALRLHVSQVEGWDYVRAVQGLNTFRGVMAGRCLFAEVFQELPGWSPPSPTSSMTAQPGC